MTEEKTGINRFQDQIDRMIDAINYKIRTTFEEICEVDISKLYLFMLQTKLAEFERNDFRKNRELWKCKIIIDRLEEHYLSHEGQSFPDELYNVTDDEIEKEKKKHE